MNYAYSYCQIKLEAKGKPTRVPLCPTLFQSPKSFHPATPGLHFLFSVLSFRGASKCGFLYLHKLNAQLEAVNTFTALYITAVQTAREFYTRYIGEPWNGAAPSRRNPEKVRAVNNLPSVGTVGGELLYGSRVRETLQRPFGWVPLTPADAIDHLFDVMLVISAEARGLPWAGIRSIKRGRLIPQRRGNKTHSWREIVCEEPVKSVYSRLTRSNKNTGTVWNPRSSMANAEQSQSAVFGALKEAIFQVIVFLFPLLIDQPGKLLVKSYCLPKKWKKKSLSTQL